MMWSQGGVDMLQCSYCGHIDCANSVEVIDNSSAKCPSCGRVIDFFPPTTVHPDSPARAIEACARTMLETVRAFNGRGFDNIQIVATPSGRCVLTARGRNISTLYGLVFQDPDIDNLRQSLQKESEPDEGEAHSS